MIKDNLEDLGYKYADWLQKQFDFNRFIPFFMPPEPENIYTIDTPFLDIYNDNIILYAYKPSNKNSVVIHDGGDILEKFTTHNIDYKKNKHLNKILKQNSISLKENVLEIKVTKIKEFHTKVTNFIQVLIELNAYISFLIETNKE